MPPSRPVPAAGGKILVYSPWKDEIMRQFGEVFEKETGVKMESINISTGEICARLKVEKARPQADIWHSGRAELLDKAREEGVLASYKPANAKDVLPPYVYPNEPTFTGTTMYPLVIAYNVNTLKKMGLEPPKAYQDLLDAKWKDKVVMPHPAANGAAISGVGRDRNPIQEGVGLPDQIEQQYVPIYPQRERTGQTGGHRRVSHLHYLL